MIEMLLQSSRSKGSSYFIEELTNEQFISYEGLSQLVSINDGILHNEGEGWLRFDYEGTELIVSKKTIRYTISWDQIHAQGCVFGERVVTINGNQYKVRLLTGADINPCVNVIGNYVEGTHHSEWSQLFYPLVTDDTYLNDQYTGLKDPRYANLELGMITENGSYSWCQETPSDYPTQRVFRGYLGVSRLHRNTSSSTHTLYGWRPCLELLLPTLTKPEFVNGYPVNTSGQYLTTPIHLSGFAFKETE